PFRSWLAHFRHRSRGGALGSSWSIDNGPPPGRQCSPLGGGRMRTVATVSPEATHLTRARALDYVLLTKPRVAVLVLFTVAAGALLAAGRSPDWLIIFHTLFGTALVAAGSSALNQYLERDSDGLMERTENRPLLAGRLMPLEVVVFGATLGIAGITYL